MDKRKYYKEKEQEVWGFRGINPLYCKTCIFAHGEPPFADLPEKVHCKIYRREEGRSKPDEVYYDGKFCDFYMKK